MKHIEIRRGLYRDSVALMQLSAAVNAVDGVHQTMIAMATPANRDLAASMGLPMPSPADSCGPNDMLIAVEARDANALAEALAWVERELAGQRLGSMDAGAIAGTGGIAAGGEIPVRTGAAAVRRCGATIALISTPGRYAFVEAMDALNAGVPVMIFSDNVSIDDEVKLKQVAAGKGLIVMGPDCGTTVLGGVGLGFANVVRPGPVGLVASSGTGAQQVMSLLGWAGVGVSHCLGVGGRDLSAAVAGRSTLAAIEALDADPATRLIVVIGKPADQAVATRVAELAANVSTPTIIGTLGPGRPDLTALTGQVLDHLDVPVPTWPRWLPGQLAHGLDRPPTDGSTLVGLFSGGTLCAEAGLIAAETLDTARYSILDLGADEYTVDRPHPMIAPDVRDRRVVEAASDPRCRVILTDLVLGHGAHPDPAGGLAHAIHEVRRRRGDDVAVVVSLIATPDDPQGPDRQATTLTDAGAAVFTSNAEAARYATDLIHGALVASRPTIGGQA